MKGVPKGKGPRTPQSAARPWSWDPGSLQWQLLQALLLRLLLPRNGVNSTICCQLLELPFREHTPVPPLDFWKDLGHGLDSENKLGLQGPPSTMA